MKKTKLFAALLSLASVAGIAIAENEKPIISTSPYGTINVQVDEEFTFTIRYQWTERIVIAANDLENESPFVWWWNRAEADMHTLEHTGVIETPNTTRVYTIAAFNGIESTRVSVTYQTGSGDEVR